MSENGRHKACNACRERKIKCDGGQPKCRRCQRNGGICFYAPPSKRYSKADFASMLETLNQRVLQAEAAAVDAQQAVRPINSSGSLVIPPAWPHFESNPGKTSSPYVDSEFNLFFPPREGYPMADVRPGHGSSSTTKSMDTPLTGTFHVADLSTNNGVFMDAEATSQFVTDKEFDFDMGQSVAHSQTRPPHLPSTEMALIAQQVSATGSSPKQSNKPGNDQTVSNFGEGPRTNNTSDATSTISNVQFGGITKERFIEFMNSNWQTEQPAPPATQVSSKNSVSFEPYTTAHSPRRENDPHFVQTPQTVPSTHVSRGNSSVSRHSSRYSTGDSNEACDCGSHSPQSAADVTQSKRRRLDSMSEKRSQSSKSPDHSNATCPHRLASSRDAEAQIDSDELTSGPFHARPVRRSIDENESTPPFTIGSTPSPCSSSMRRNIGSGTAFQGIIKLQGASNYQDWVRAIRAAARKEGVWDMMTGLCQKPCPPKPGSSLAVQQRYHDDIVYWSNKSELALGGLEGSLSEAIQEYVDNIECARAIWLRLEQKFKPVESKTVYNAVQELSSLSLRNTGGVEDLANKLRLSREKLNSLTRDALLPEWYFSVRFMLSLGHDYEDLISSVLSVESNFADNDASTSFERIVARAMSEERRLLS